MSMLRPLLGFGVLYVVCRVIDRSLANQGWNLDNLALKPRSTVAPAAGGL